MEKITCELCGSNEIVKENDMFVCKQCGTKYTVEEAQKLIGKVDVENSKEKEIENWLVLARRARLEGNNVNASKYYGLISEQDPNNWEAAFYQKYFQASGCSLAGIAGAISTIMMSYITTFTLICNLESDSDKLAALKEISNSTMDFADSIGNVSVGYKEKNSDNNYSQQSANQWMMEATKLYLTVTSFVHESEKTAWLNTADSKKYAVEVRKRYNNYLAKYGDALNKKYRDSQMSEATRYIGELDENYEQPEKESTEPSASRIGNLISLIFCIIFVLIMWFVIKDQL